VTFFDDETTMTSLKWRHNWFFKVCFCHNLVKSHNFRPPTAKIKGRWGQRAPGLGYFENWFPK